jgi:Novel STAND NTPase 1
VLPLLSHALDQTWRSRAGEVLTPADYERTGGTKGAVAGSAQRAYGHLTPGQQKAARRVFTRLTATSPDGADTADRATRAELTQGNRDPRRRPHGAAGGCGSPG